MPCHTPFRGDTSQLLLFKIACCLAEGGPGPVGGVTSFNSRTGAVTLTSGDVTGALGFTPENVANKSTDTNLGNSDTLYPSQNAVKVYVDSKPAGDVLDSDWVNWEFDPNATALVDGDNDFVLSEFVSPSWITANFYGTIVFLGGPPGIDGNVRLQIWYDDVNTVPQVLDLTATQALVSGGTAAFILRGSELSLAGSVNLKIVLHFDSVTGTGGAYNFFLQTATSINKVASQV